MLYLAKILPIFVLPTGVIILLLVLSLVLRRRALAVAALAVLWLSSTPLVERRPDARGGGVAGPAAGGLGANGRRDCRAVRHAARRPGPRADG